MLVMLIEFVYTYHVCIFTSKYTKGQTKYTNFNLHLYILIILQTKYTNHNIHLYILTMFVELQAKYKNHNLYSKRNYDIEAKLS